MSVETTSFHLPEHVRLAVDSARDKNKIHGRPVSKWLAEELCKWLTLEEVSGLISSLEFLELRMEESREKNDRLIASMRY